LFLRFAAFALDDSAWYASSDLIACLGRFVRPVFTPVGGLRRVVGTLAGAGLKALLRRSASDSSSGGVLMAPRASDWAWAMVNRLSAGGLRGIRDFLDHAVFETIEADLGGVSSGDA